MYFLLLLFKLSQMSGGYFYFEWEAIHLNEYNFASKHILFIIVTKCNI